MEAIPPQIAPPSEADGVAQVEQQINEMYNQSKQEQENEQTDKIKKSVLDKYDEKLRGLGFLTKDNVQPVIKDIVNELMTATQQRQTELDIKINKLSELLLRAKAQGKIPIEPEKQPDSLSEAREVFKGIIPL